MGTCNTAKMFSGRSSWVSSSMATPPKPRSITRARRAPPCAESHKLGRGEPVQAWTFPGGRGPREVQVWTLSVPACDLIQWKSEPTALRSALELKRALVEPGRTARAFHRLQSCRDLRALDDKGVRRQRGLAARPARHLAGRWRHHGPC